MKRNFYLRYIGLPTEEIVVGVYMLHIGNAFYIGKSKNIRQRAKQHKYELGKLLEKHGSDPSSILDYHYQFKAFHQLVENPEIKRLGISLIESCTEEELQQCEQKWLEESAWMPNCLNMGFESKPSSHDVRMANGN